MTTARQHANAASKLADAATHRAAAARALVPVNVTDAAAQFRIAALRAREAATHAFQAEVLAAGSPAARDARAAAVRADAQIVRLV